MALLLFFAVVPSSLQGLYTTAPTSGQLYVTANISAPSRVAVGAALTAQGFLVPDDSTCAAAAIDQTRKLHYTLARNASVADNATGWTLVGVYLASGVVRTANMLPAGFSLPSRCMHTLDVDDADRLLVSALNDAGSLDLVRIFPDTGATEVLASGARAPGISQPAASTVKLSTSSVFHDLSNTLWLLRGAQITGFNVTSRAFDRSAALPPSGGAAFASGLSFDPYDGRLYTVLTAAAGGVALASFNPAATAPVLSRVEVQRNLLSRVIGDSRSVTVLQEDGGSIAVLGAGAGAAAGTWELIVLRTDGRAATSTPRKSAVLCGGISECPSSLLFEPFVF